MKVVDAIFECVPCGGSGQVTECVSGRYAHWQESRKCLDCWGTGWEVTPEQLDEMLAPVKAKLAELETR